MDSLKDPASSIASSYQLEPLSPQTVQSFARLFGVDQLEKIRTAYDLSLVVRNKYYSFESLEFWDLGTFGAEILALAFSFQNPSMKAKSLTLQWNNIQSVTVFSKLLSGTSICELDLAENPLKDYGFEEILLNLGQQIEKIDVYNCDIIKVNSLSLSRCTKLKVLNIQLNSIGNKGFQELIRGVERVVEVLGVCACEITLIPEELTRCSCLSDLSLSYNNIQDKGFQVCLELLNPSKIQKLEVSGCNIHHIPEDLLSNFQRLCHLDISFNKIGNIGFEMVLKTVGFQIQNLVLKSCEITEVNIDFLKRCFFMLRLDLSGNKIGSKGFSSILLGAFPYLQTLQLSDCQIEEIVPSSLLKKYEKLQELDLSQNPFGDNGFENVVPWISENITKLNLANCKITKVNPRLLRSCFNLNDLILDKNPLTDEEDTLELIETVKLLPNLKNLSPDPLPFLSRIIKLNSSLLFQSIILLLSTTSSIKPRENSLLELLSRDIVKKIFLAFGL